MTILIPPNNKWSQTGNSDVFGTLWASQNIDLSENEGRLRLGKRLMLSAGTVDNSDMNNYPVGYRNFQDNGGTFNFTVMGSYVWKGYVVGTSGVAMIKDAHTNLPPVDSAISDIEVFNSELYVTANSADAYYLRTSDTAWQQAAGMGRGSNAVSLTVYGTPARLYAGGQTTISSMDTSHVVATSSSYTLTLPDPGLAITFLRSTSNRIWVGTVNTGTGKGYIYDWDGVSTLVTQSYRLESAGALSCVIKDDRPYVMDANGVLLTWNGGTFVPLAKLNRPDNKILIGGVLGTNMYIHKNGMSLIQGRISALINGRNNDSTYNETIPSGVYEYDPNKGLIHKHSISPVKLSGTISDYGNINVKNVGALSEFNTTTANAFLAGASYFSDATTVAAGIFYNNLATDVQMQRAGSFITTKLSDPQSVQNNFNNLWVMYKKFLTSGDKIIPKYRTSEADPVTGTITWTSTTTFTVANSAVVVSNYWTAGTGNEVEVLNGVGAGRCSHITNAVLAAGTWTVTVDETYTGATGTAVARFQNWVKLTPITQGDGETFKQMAIGAPSNWIQFKLWMLWTGKDELEKLFVVNSEYNKPK